MDIKCGPDHISITSLIHTIIKGPFAWLHILDLSCYRLLDNPLTNQLAVSQLSQVTVNSRTASNLIT